MYKYYNKAQDFVDLWTTLLKLPPVVVKLNKSKKDRMVAKVCPNRSKLYLYFNNVISREHFITVLLHEICHVWYYWRFKDLEYKDEKKAILQTAYLIKKHYKSYFNYILKLARLWADSDYEAKYKDYYLGHLAVLKKYEKTN